MSHGLMVTADMYTTPQLAEIARNAERCGFDNIWVPELFGREPFVTCATLLAATDTVHVGTAIANVYVRDARATRAAAYSLAEAFGNRFELGIGVSNKLGNTQRGLPWEAPAKKLNEFLDYYDTSQLMFKHEGQVPVYLAAHGPVLMKLAATRLDGAYAYMMPVDYSRSAKDKLGGKKLHIMQTTVFRSAPDEARELARQAVSIYMPLENYHRAWREAGFSDADFTEGGNDHFIDTLIAWGDVERISERYALQREHGVDQVIVGPVGLDLTKADSWGQLDSLLKSNR